MILEIPTVEDLKAIQTQLGIRDQHVVWIGPSWFVIAHTDEERASINLRGCDLHVWLHSLDGPPVSTGYYVAHPHMPDAYSEPYGADRWDFVPIEAVSDE